MKPAPEVRKRGLGPTGIVAMSLLVFGSILSRESCSKEETQMKPLLKGGFSEPEGRSMEAETRLVAGSMRTSVEGLATIQTEPAPTVIPPSELAGTTAM